MQNISQDFSRYLVGGISRFLALNLGYKVAALELKVRKCNEIIKVLIHVQLLNITTTALIVATLMYVE